MTPRVVPSEKYGLVLVESSEGGIFYGVDAAARRCPCAAGKHGRQCRHLAAADLWAVQSRGVQSDPSSPSPAAPPADDPFRRVAARERAESARPASRVFTPAEQERLDALLSGR